MHLSCNVPGEKGPAPLEVRVRGCDEQPCVFVHGTEVHAEVDFRVGEYFIKIGTFRFQSNFSFLLFLLLHDVLSDPTDFIVALGRTDVLSVEIFRISSHNQL